MILKIILIIIGLVVWWYLARPLVGSLIEKKQRDSNKNNVESEGCEA